jgi:hypothetical protein
VRNKAAAYRDQLRRHRDFSFHGLHREEKRKQKLFNQAG